MESSAHDYCKPPANQAPMPRKLLKCRVEPGPKYNSEKLNENFSFDCTKRQELKFRPFSESKVKQF